MLRHFQLRICQVRSACLFSVRSESIWVAVLSLMLGVTATVGPRQADAQDVAGKRSGTEATDTHWNQWRGAERDATVAEADWPAKLQLEMVWEADGLGPSYSGPVSNGKMVFTTETVDKKTEVVSAYDLKTGERAWQASWPGAMQVPFFAASNGSWIRSTPACDAESVYVVGIQDRLVCLNAANGEVRWELDFAQRYNTGNPPFGAVCSPLLDGEFLYLQAANRFFKLQKSDGRVIWETMNEEGGMSSGGSFSSPSFGTIDGKRQLLVQSRMTLAGIDPESGKVLWQTPVPNFRGMNILTPSLWNQQVFTSSYNNQSYLYDVKSESQVKQVWKNSAKGYMASPAIIGDRAYLLLQNGRMGCLDLASGERLWTSDSKVGDYVSCLINGQQVLWLSNEGELYLMKAGDDFLGWSDTYQLPGVNNSWAHIGLQNLDGERLLLIRSIDRLQVYRWK